MKSPGSFHVILRLYPLWICLIVLALIIHSCKKENKVSQPVISDAIVGQARQWYESNYAKATTRSTVRTQAAGTAIQDWSKTFSPEWAKASKFMQDSLIFIELPALKRGDMAISKKQMDPNKFDFSRSGNLTSLIIVNKKGAFYIYAMTILADSAYLKSDYGKIKNNTYRKRDKDFTGSVLYHRLDGSFVNGWRYTNGAITGVINQIPVATSATRSLIHVSKQPKTATVACTTWLVTTYWEDCAYYSNDYSYANPFDCFSYSTESIFTSCSSVSSGGGTGSTSPPPCQIPTSPGTAVTASATKTLTRQVAPTGDGTVTGGIVDPTTQIGTSTLICPPTPPPTPPDTSNRIIKSYCDSVNASAQQQIQAAITSFRSENCVQSGIFNYFVNNNISFTFCVNNSLTAAGNSNVTAGNITFTPGTIASVMNEELFHQYQNMVYSGGIGQYATNGRADIEFEAAFFGDVLNQTGNAMFRNSSDRDAYLTWIKSVTNNNTTYPKSLSTADLSQYYYFLGLYNQTHPEYNTPLKLNPTAALTAFTNYNCKP